MHGLTVQNALKICDSPPKCDGLGGTLFAKPISFKLSAAVEVCDEKTGKTGLSDVVAAGD